MKMIAYWKNKNDKYEPPHDGEPFCKEKYGESSLKFIYGFYNHENQSSQPEKGLGIYWGNRGNFFPRSRGGKYLCPLFIPAGKTCNAILSGLLYQAISDKSKDEREKISEAIEFFKS